MKQIAAVFISLLVIMFASCKLTSVRYNRYDKDELMTGWWLLKNDTSCVQLVKYKKGFRDGTSKKMFNNGQYAISHYKHGKLNGTEKIYSEDGHLTRTRIYVNDSLIKETIEREVKIDLKKYRRM